MCITTGIRWKVVLMRTLGFRRLLYSMKNTSCTAHSVANCRKSSPTQMKKGMAKVSVGDRVYRHEAKPQPTEIRPGKIVEAFGLGKCPKLVEQVRSDNIEVRVNTLKVLCEEFKNPSIIAGVTNGGLMSTLPGMTVDPDLNTRISSSRAMVAAARDYNGRKGLLEAGAPETIFSALDDHNRDVRENIYRVLANMSTSGPEPILPSTHGNDMYEWFYVLLPSGRDSLVLSYGAVLRLAVRSPSYQGTSALTQAGYPAKLVGKTVNEVPELQPLALKVLYSLIKRRRGLEEAIEASLVENLIGLLGKEGPADVQREASITLALACFDEMAKITAIQNDGVSMLAGLLSAPSRDVRSAAMGALMMITTVDAGKRAILSTSAAEEAVKALGEEDGLLLLNALKLVASIAAHPGIRAELRGDEACLPAIRALKDSHDPMIAKHAAVALDAVLWEP